MEFKNVSKIFLPNNKEVTKITRTSDNVVLWTSQKIYLIKDGLLQDGVTLTFSNKDEDSYTENYSIKDTTTEYAYDHKGIYFTIHGGGGYPKTAALNLPDSIKYQCWGRTLHCDYIKIICNQGGASGYNAFWGYTCHYCFGKTTTEYSRVTYSAGETAQAFNKTFKDSEIPFIYSEYNNYQYKWCPVVYLGTYERSMTLYIGDLYFV